MRFPMKRRRSGMRLFLLLAALGGLVAAHAHGGKTVRGSGKVTNDARSVQGIRKVNAHGVGILLIEIGSGESLTVEAEDNLQAQIEATVRPDGTLDIGPKGDSDIQPTRPIRYRLRLPHLDAVALSGATQAEVNGTVTTDDFALNLSGATSAKLSRVEADKLDIQASGASKVTLSGTVKRQKLDFSGVSQYHGFDLTSNEADVDASGTSKIELKAKDRLRVDASGVTQVRYKGKPDVRSKTSGLSSVSAD
jgi:hypothetical protein